MPRNQGATRGPRVAGAVASSDSQGAQTARVWRPGEGLASVPGTAKAPEHIVGAGRLCIHVASATSGPSVYPHL